MTIEEINQIVLDESNIILILDRIYNILSDQTVPDGEDKYLIINDNTYPVEERYAINCPSGADVNSTTILTEFNSYISELLLIEQARLDEIARVEDIEARWSALTCERSAVSRAGFDIPNLALELRRITQENDQSMLSLIEIADAEYSIIKAEKDSRENKKNLGRDAKKVCSEVMDLVRGYNITAGLSKVEINQMKITFKEVWDSLKDGQPWTAKELVLAIQVDGVIVTQEMKDDILKEFSESGLEGL